ncbi:hypothetical protein DFH09DRAFT_1338091 [Mycena vulgaris]|nr:hypothetical protein DFH09DRAFT_1338091 [Mycena vulgaris]
MKNLLLPSREPVDETRPARTRPGSDELSPRFLLSDELSQILVGITNFRVTKVFVNAYATKVVVPPARRASDIVLAPSTPRRLPPSNTSADPSPSAETAFIGHFVYLYTVTSAGNPFALKLSRQMQQEIGSVVGTMVKCCFATRVYRFSERNTFITAFIVLLALGQLGVAIVFRTRLPALVDPPSLNLKMLATISLTLGVLTDVVTAASLCFFLWRMRTGQSSAANSLINRLVTEILTTVVSLSTLLLFDFLDGNLIFAAMYFLLSKLYAVSFLATLNTRRAIRGRGTDHEQASATSRRTGVTGGSRRPTTVGRDAEV